MRGVLFDTLGLIDPRAFTTFGINAKPNSINPIGYFGTGLKYAIAVLCRENLGLEVWVGFTKYVFYPSDIKFRGQDFSVIRMKRETWNLSNLVGKSYIELPFTTQHGKNWKLWQAFRELESNTRDEGSSAQLVTGPENVIPEQGRTKIVVWGESFVEEWAAMNKTFLPVGQRTLLFENSEAQVLRGASKHIYYRGLRVLDLEKPTLYTYNFLGYMSLTEDRTLAFQFEVDQKIGSLVAKAEEEQYPYVKNSVTADQAYYEHSMKWDYLYEAPGETFKRVMAEPRVPDGLSYSAGASTYYGGWAPRAQRVDPFKDNPRPWSTRRLGSAVYDARENHMFTLAEGPSKDLAIAIVKAVNDWKGD